MAGGRQPTAVLQAKGKKHLTRAEIDQRLDSEVKAPVPSKAKPPKWLAKEYRAEFKQIATQLIDLGIYSDLDADTLGRYLTAHGQWLLVTEQVSMALAAKNVDDASAWSSVQDKYFKQARACALDLGLTISSRCRLVLPHAANEAAEESEDEFTRALRCRQKAVGE